MARSRAMQPRRLLRIAVWKVNRSPGNDVFGGDAESSGAEVPLVLRYLGGAATRARVSPGPMVTGPVARAPKNCELLSRSRSRELFRVDAAQTGAGVGLTGFRPHANRLTDFHRWLAARLAGRLAAGRFGAARDRHKARPRLAQPVASWRLPEALATGRARYEQENRQTDAAADLFDGLHASSIGTARSKNLSRVQEKDSRACIGRVVGRSRCGASGKGREPP
jgi:hypothetical protein